MDRLLISCVSSLFLAASALASDQSIRTVRACVTAEPSFNSAAPPNSTTESLRQRDLLVDYLNHQKPSHNIKVEAVALTTMDRNGFGTEARAKHCDYTVVLSLGSFNPELAAGVGGESSPFAAHSRPFGQDAAVRRVVVMCSVQDNSNGETLPGGCSDYAPRSNAAMSVGHDVYTAIVKASAP